MSDSNHFAYGRRRRVAAALSCAIGVLLLSVGGAALAAETTHVVPPHGRAAGHGYSYWLERSWQFVFSSSPPVKPCQALSANGQGLGYLTLATLAPGTYRFACGEPAGRPLYVDELSAECSTFNGDHGGFGTTVPQLKRCARATFNGIKNTTTLDGHRVTMQRLIAATGVYPVHIGKNDAFGASPGDGRSAAYGYGLLLTGLGKGSHVIHSLASAGRAVFDITWTLHIR